MIEAKITISLRVVQTPEVGVDGSGGADKGYVILHPIPVCFMKLVKICLGEIIWPLSPLAVVVFDECLCD